MHTRPACGTSREQANVMSCPLANAGSSGREADQDNGSAGMARRRIAGKGFTTGAQGAELGTGEYAMAVGLHERE